MQFDRTVKVLLVEDNPGDARYVQEMLNDVFSHHYHVTHVALLHDALPLAAEKKHDILLLDLSLPDGNGLQNLKNISATNSDIPVIVLTGYDDEETALSAVRQGAQDYLIKGYTESHLLDRSIRYAIERKELALEREHLILELQNALANIKTLKGLIPICSNCKKIRNDHGAWQQLEAYIHEHTAANFSHGICNDCLHTLYPDVADEVLASVQQQKAERKTQNM